MPRWRPLLLTVAPLVTAGLAFGVLGSRAIRLERAEAGRLAGERAESAVGVGAVLLPELARGLTPTDAIRRDDGPGLDLPSPTSEDDRTVLVEQAVYLERTGDLEGAARGWLGLAGLGAGAQLSTDGAICLVRAAALRTGLSQPQEAARLLDVVLKAPAVGDDAKVLALRHLYRVLSAADRSDVVRRFVTAADEGRLLRFDGAPDRGDLLIVVEREVEADPRPLEPEVGTRLRAAALRAERGHRLLAALHGGAIGTVDRHVGWLDSGGARLMIASPASLEGSLSARLGQPVRLADATEPLRPGERRARPEAEALAGLEVRASPHLGSGGDGPTLAWVALGMGLLLFGLGGTFALLALRRAEHAARMQSDFVAAVSHEMKTPIAGVQAMAEMLAEGRVSEPARAQDYAERIRAEMGRLGATVRDVLDVSRIERDPTALVRPHPGDPGAVVLDALAVARPALERRGFVVRADVTASPTPLPIDPDALAHVMHNLLDNAAKFSTDRREIVVTGAPPAPTAGPSGNGATHALQGYRIEVADRGPGIPLSDRERIFDRFFRGEDARHRAIPGVGLGLHVAREIVRAHGATLKALERSGGGARFVIDFPGGDA